MPLFLKKKEAKALEKKETDLKYMLDSLSSELTDTEKHLENIAYQIEFFGATPELRDEKEDCELMLSWIQLQFDEIKKNLFTIHPTPPLLN